MTDVRFANSQVDGLSNPITSKMISPIPNPFLLGHIMSGAQAHGLVSTTGTRGVAKGTFDPPNSFFCAAEHH